MAPPGWTWLLITALAIPTLCQTTGNECAAGTTGAIRAYNAAADRETKRKTGMNGVRCAMRENQTGIASVLIEKLTADFKNDPEVLYLAVHTYSDLALRASQSLLYAHPDAYQVHQLNAESLETQGRWDDAAAEYRAILAKYPNLPGLHYRLGRLILSRPATPATPDDARREFESELKIDPANAGAEFVLGELARQAEQWPEAIKHFTRATQIDPHFTDAFVGLGRACLADGKPLDAIPSLEAAVKLQPANPAIHFHLANAYRRAGRKADADRESQTHQRLSEQALRASDGLKKAVGGFSVEKITK